MTKGKAPKWPLRILKIICSERQLEILYGDVLEVFERRSKERGPFRAKVLFYWDVLSLLRFFSFKAIRFSSTCDMYRSYLKLSFRSLLRNRLSFMINFIGLSVGFFAVLSIAQYVAFESNYDRFHPFAEDTYRVSYLRAQDDQIAFNGATTFLPVGPIMEERYSEVLNQCRFYYSFTHGIINYEDQAYHEEKPVFADASFFDLFGFELLEGAEKIALAEPKSVVLSERVARKYFGSEQSLGKLIRFTFEDGSTDLQVTGVMPNPRPDSHLQFDMLMSFSTLEQWEVFRTSDWQLPFYHTYIQLEAGTDVGEFERSSAEIIEKNRAEQLGSGVEEFILQPLRDIHLDSHLTFELGNNGDRQALKFLILIAVLILIIVYLNYINLSTALSSLRGKEVGIHKVMGSHGGQIVPRFLLEALIINALALAASVIATYFAADSLAKQFGIHLDFSTDLEFWLVVVAVTAAGAILSSLYPAIMTSAIRPISALRGKLSLTSGGANMRKVLIGMQYLISISMIGGMILISRQTDYLLTKDLGFNSEELLVLSAPRSNGSSSLLQQLEVFKSEVLFRSDVSEYTLSNSVPGRVMSSGMIGRAGVEGSGAPVYFMSASESYFRSYGLEVLAGRIYSEQSDADLERVLVNEAAVLAFGYRDAESAVGSRLSAGSREVQIIGVVGNYHHSSLKSEYEPIVFRLPRRDPIYISMKVSTSNLPATLEGLRTMMKDHFPESPFEYFFLDSVFDQEFKTELQYGSLLRGLSVLAVLLASLGLFGMSSFLIIQRTKEIGIRKVLGASGVDFFYLLARYFASPLVAASILATVVLYLLGSAWLQMFPFRIDLPVAALVVPILIATSLTALTLFALTLKTLSIEPAETLKNE